MDRTETKVDLILDVYGKAFVEEQGRKQRLEDKAERLIGVIALVAGVGILNVDQLVLYGNRPIVLSGWLAVIGFIALGFALILAILSRRILKYLSYPRGEIIMDQLKPASVPLDQAKIKIQ